MLELRTCGAEFSLLPTPVVGDARGAGGRTIAGSKANAGVSLTDVVVHGQELNGAHQDRQLNAGRLDPQFVEWMMGFPTDFTVPD